MVIDARGMLDVFVTFMRVGSLGFGGGPSMVPLLQEEVVDVRGWLTAAEFAELLALGNALPGPIMTKLAAVIGQRVAGLPGSMAGLVGLVLPSALMMGALAAAAVALSDQPRIAGALRAARPAVVGMLAWTAWVVAKGSSSGLDARGTAWFAAIAVASFGVLVFLDLHPALVLVVAMLVGALWLA